MPNALALSDLHAPYPNAVRNLKIDYPKEKVMTPEAVKKATTELIVQVMKIQKTYAHEKVGAKNDRRSEIKKAINRIASELEAKKNAN
jgi:hypothetical protein